MAEPTPKVALITGAARRIGAVIARDLGREGWAVAVHYKGSASEAADALPPLPPI
jgi:NAD(P)-dependent dehydrogenase (short-subunit alcohol dehydrogenase family)